MKWKKHHPQYLAGDALKVYQDGKSPNLSELITYGGEHLTGWDVLFAGGV